MKLIDNILLAFEIVFYFFHSSLLIVLIVECKTKFYGVFYNMLRLLFIADILCFISSFISRFIIYGFWRDFFKDNTFIATIDIHFASYFMLLQFSVHGFLAFNRSTLFWFPSSYKKIWSVQWYTVILLIIPLILISPQITETGKYTFMENGAMIFDYENPEIMNSALIIALIYCIFITFVSAIFNSLALLKYYFYKKNKITSAAVISINEIAALYVSCVVFFIHSFACFLLIGRTFFGTFDFFVYAFEASWPIMSDLFAINGSISLICFSKLFRNTYVEFYNNLLNAHQMFIRIPAITNLAK